METIAVANQKGGVGKTTTAFHLAVGLALRDLRVLVVDLDPQGHLTMTCRVQPSDLTVLEVLTGKVDARSAIVSSIHGIDVLGSDQLLATFEKLEWINDGVGISRLRWALSPVADDYDWCVIDTPPSLGLLSSCGIVAADRGVMVPIIPEAFSVQGLDRLAATVEDLSKSHRWVDLHSVVPSMVRSRWVNHRETVETLPGLIECGVPTAPSIPNHGAVAIASALRTSVFAAAPKTTVALAYEQLAGYVVDKRVELSNAS